MTRGAYALLVVAAVTALLVWLVASERRTERWPEPVRTATAVGDSTCLSCHRDKASFEGTAHRITTRLPTRESILGGLRSGENVLRTTSAAVHYRVGADSLGFYETAVVGIAPDTSSRTEHIALVAGSGRRGQSYLYWSGDRLFQLPVSYWTSIGHWINSPGPAYVDGKPNFDRAIAPRCLECHATWIESVPELAAVNRYVPASAIVGITCERCHGAGAEHVRRERSLWRAARPAAIVNPKRLSRERQMEACAQCHGGLGSPTLPPFTYVAGRRLDDYLARPPRASDAVVDVHGNQVALLERSRCYRASGMTCLTCHDVHRTQRDTTELSQRCLGCHQEQSCGLFATRGHALAGRCVSCHMPVQSSKLIVSSLDGAQQQARIRNHWIRVYLDTLAARRVSDASAGRSTSPPDRRAPARKVVARH